MLLNEHPQLKNFFSCPIYSHIYVNKNGYVFNDLTNRFLNISQTGKRYQLIDIGGKSVPMHRVLAETFLDKPENPGRNKLVVNHLDGIKGNNSLSNLEWTTYSGNNTHAYKTGLRADNHVILLKEVGKDEIHEFHSLQETARYLDVNGHKVHKYLKNRFRRRPLLEKYLLTYKGEEWPNEANALAIKPYNCGLPVDIVVTDTKDKKSFIIEGYKGVSEFTGISLLELRYALSKARPAGKTITKGQFEICYLEDYHPYLDSQPERIKSDIKDTKFVKGGTHIARPPKPILVTDLNTHEQYKLDSSETLSIQLGVKKNTLQKHIWKNNGIWKNHLKIEYL